MLWLAESRKTSRFDPAGLYNSRAVLKRFSFLRLWRKGHRALQEDVPTSAKRAKASQNPAALPIGSCEVLGIYLWPKLVNSEATVLDRGKVSQLSGHEGTRNAGQAELLSSEAYLVGRLFAVDNLA